MIDKAGWFDWAIKDPGPPSKVNGGKNTCWGVVPHSAEGYWTALRYLLHNGPASWGASNLQNGRFYQHYPVTAQTWTSGAAYPNNHFFAFENEGIAGQPLTDPQVANIVRVIRELSTAYNWMPERPTHMNDVGATLYEHRECVRWGADPTACPSNRIPWDRILAELEDEDMRSFLAWCPQQSATYFVGPSGAKWITSPAVAAELERVFGKVSVVLSAEAINAIGVRQ